MGKHPFDEYRKEIKFLVPMNLLAQLENHLKKMRFVEQYRPRKINSIYFDTYLDELLQDSMDGLADRQKLRIRFYNGGEELHFEKKIKSDALGKKEIYKLNDFPFEVENIIELERYVKSNIQTSVRATAKVAYFRKYYFLEKENVRVTIDTNIQTEDLIFGRNRKMENYFLVEVKCARKIYFDLNLPLMPQRFSKYAFARFAE